MVVKSILVESELQQEPEFVNKRFTCVWQWPMVLQPLLNAHAPQLAFGLAHVANKPCFGAEALAPQYMKSKTNLEGQGGPKEWSSMFQAYGSSSMPTHIWFGSSPANKQCFRAEVSAGVSAF